MSCTCTKVGVEMSLSRCKYKNDSDSKVKERWNQVLDNYITSMNQQWHIKPIYKANPVI